MTKKALKGRLALMRQHLEKHKGTLFAKQHRDGKRKNKFDLQGSFKIGLGSTQPGHLQHLGKPGFVRHNFKNTAAFVKPVHEQELPYEQRHAYQMASDILNMVDPDYAAGEYLVQFAHMCSDEHKVEKHVDKEDISHQYALPGAHRAAPAPAAAVWITINKYKAGVSAFKISRVPPKTTQCTNSGRG
jgi:hypothetical protein